MNSNQHKKDLWGKLGPLSALLASVFIPLVIVIVGNEYSSAIKESENRVRYTELSIKILNEKPKEDNKNVRRWAIDVLNKYSGVKIDAETRKELLGQSLLADVDKFVKDVYAPYQIKAMIESFRKDEQWLSAVKDRDSEALAEMTRILLEVVVDEILSYSAEIKHPILNQTEGIESEKVKEALRLLKTINGVRHK